MPPSSVILRKKYHFADAGKMVVYSRFLRAGPLGEGGAEDGAPPRRQTGGGFPLLLWLLHPAGRHFDFDDVAAVIAFEQCPEVVTVHGHAVRATEIDSFDIA